MDELYGKKYVFKGQTLSSLLSPKHAGNLNGKLRYHFEEIDPIKDDAKARILRFIITGVGEFDGRLFMMKRSEMKNSSSTHSKPSEPTYASREVCICSFIFTSLSLSSSSSMVFLHSSIKSIHLDI